MIKATFRFIFIYISAACFIGLPVGMQGMDRGVTSVPTTLGDQGDDEVDGLSPDTARFITAVNTGDVETAARCLADGLPCDAITFFRRMNRWQRGLIDSDEVVHAVTMRSEALRFKAILSVVLVRALLIAAGKGNEDVCRELCFRGAPARSVCAAVDGFVDSGTIDVARALRVKDTLEKALTGALVGSLLSNDMSTAREIIFPQLRPANITAAKLLVGRVISGFTERRRESLLRLISDLAADRMIV